MSIAIQRIKRAIAGMPTGGMQTGKQHIKLEHSDAQRAIAEIESLTAERDALQTQVDELRVKSKALVEQAERTLDFDIGNHHALKGTAYALDNALDATPAACLAHVRAEAGRAGFVAGTECCSDYLDTYYADIDFTRHADQYAELIRQGGTK